MHKGLKILHGRVLIITRVCKVLCENKTKILSYEAFPSFRLTSSVSVWAHLGAGTVIMIFDREHTVWWVSSLGPWMCLVSASSHWISSCGVFFGKYKSCSSPHIWWQACQQATFYCSKACLHFLPLKDLLGEDLTRSVSQLLNSRLEPGLRSEACTARSKTSATYTLNPFLQA